MRESFVFHAEYIEDLPGEYKARFIEYTVNYGLTGKSPEIEDGTLESTVWKKIARRIDAEAEKYRITSERRKEAALRRYGKVYGEQKTEKPVEAKSDEPPKETKKNFEKPTVEMKDWRASVRTWEQRRKTEQTGGRNKAGGMWGNENEIPDEITDLF